MRSNKSVKVLSFFVRGEGWGAAAGGQETANLELNVAAAAALQASCLRVVYISIRSGPGAAFSTVPGAGCAVSNPGRFGPYSEYRTRQPPSPSLVPHAQSISVSSPLYSPTPRAPPSPAPTRGAHRTNQRGDSCARSIFGAEKDLSVSVVVEVSRFADIYFCGCRGVMMTA